MAAGGSRLDDPAYKNWLKDTLALMYMKEGLECFCDAQSKLFHAGLLSSCRTGCTSGCTFTDLKKNAQNHRWQMKCTPCDDWLTEVISYHTNNPFPQLSPENTDPQKWHTDHWETSKLFMPHGCRADRCAKDSDILCMLSLYINSRYFITSGHISRADLLLEIKEIRNALFHSSNFQVSDTVVNDHLQKIIDFLQGMTGLADSESQCIQEAILKIQKLQANLLDLSLNKELELRALQQRQIEWEREMKSLESTVEALKKDQDNHEIKLNSTEVSIKQLKETKDRFEEFLEANNLKDDIAGLSTQLSTQLQETQTQFKEHEERVDLLGSQIQTLEEQMKTKADIPVACSSKTNWEKQCKDLQQALIDHYKSTCLFVQNPAESNDIGLEYLCVDPNIRVLGQSKGRDGLKNVKEATSSFSCRNIFFNEEYQSRQIYITGEAGSGKSMMCKNIVRLWCEAHGLCLPNESEESESDSEDEVPRMFTLDRTKQRRLARKQSHREKKALRNENIQILSNFTLLFYIALRDSLSEYSVNEMIQSQILKYHVSVKGLGASDLLSNELCLVIMDGLDEWVCPAGAPVPPFLNPGIPGRDIFNKTNVFLTTIRPWKFEILQLKSSEVDKHVELCALNEQAASKICFKVVKLLNKSQVCRKSKSEFLRIIEQKGLGHFKTIPVLLIQLICLWFDNQELGKSQVQLYCAMLDLLLKKSKKNLSVQTTYTPAIVASTTSLSNCITSHPYCKNNQQLIYCLSRLSFESLFDKTKENSLVFNSSQLEIYGVGQESIDMCLKSGILSQNKVYGKCSVSEKKISILHRKFQEFLAAVFLASCDNVQDVIKRITDFCSTLDTCLEMSQVWLFVSGIRPDITRQLLDHLTCVATSETKVEHYRQTLGGQGLIRDIQTCVADCVIEGDNNEHSYDNVMLENLWMDRNTACHVERLLSCIPWSKIKSVFINTGGIDARQLTRVTDQLELCTSVHKLHLFDPWSRIDIRTVTQIVNNNHDTLTCLDLKSKVTATDEFVTYICSTSSKCLMALRLSLVRMSHEHIKQILTRLPQLPTISQLVLWLHCSDHDRQCRPMIDLSSMTKIQRLVLYYMSVDNLQSVAHCVKYVRLYRVKLPVTTLCEFAKTRRHVHVELDNVTVIDVKDPRVGVRTFRRYFRDLKVKHCKYNSDNTWCIFFTTRSQ